MSNQQNDQQPENTGMTITNTDSSAQLQPFKSVISEVSAPLKDILMASITKVQNDPTYIGQAKEIRDNVRELVNLARVEVDMVREMRKVKA